MTTMLPHRWRLLRIPGYYMALLGHSVSLLSSEHPRVQESKLEINFSVAKKKRKGIPIYGKNEGNS